MNSGSGRNNGIARGAETPVETFTCLREKNLFERTTAARRAQTDKKIFSVSEVAAERELLRHLQTPYRSARGAISKSFCKH